MSSYKIFINKVPDMKYAIVKKKKKSLESVNSVLTSY